MVVFNFYDDTNGFGAQTDLTAPSAKIHFLLGDVRRQEASADLDSGDLGIPLLTSRSSSSGSRTRLQEQGPD